MMLLGHDGFPLFVAKNRMLINEITLVSISNIDFNKHLSLMEYSKPSGCLGHH